MCVKRITKSNGVLVCKKSVKKSWISGFSLAEAMITLLMISIILAAMAPIMSKKMKLTQTGHSSATLSKKKAWYKATPGTYEFPAQFGITDYTITMVAGGGGGGNSLKTPVDIPVTSTTTQTLTIPEGVSSINLTLVGAGGGGGGGNAQGGVATGQSGSKNFTTVGTSYFTPNMMNAGCTAFNNTSVTYEIVGGGSTSNPGGSGGKATGTTTLTGASFPAVVGGTGNPGGTSSFNSISATGGSGSSGGSPNGQVGSSQPTYSRHPSCEVSACAAKFGRSTSEVYASSCGGGESICTDSNCSASNYPWVRFGWGGTSSSYCECTVYWVNTPTISGFGAVAVYLNNTHYGTMWIQSQRQGAPYYMYSCTASATEYNGGSVGSYGRGYGSTSGAATAGRVYLSWSGASCTSVVAAAGGGGGSGASATLTNIPVAAGDTLTLTVGTGGVAGLATSKGGDGTATSVTHKDKDGRLIKQYTVDGGSGGNGATTTAHGIGGAGGAKGDYTAGNAGATGTASNGGNGGNIVISGTTQTGGLGGTSASINGKAPASTSAYGAGGGGGFATDGSNLGTGGKGSNGFIRIEYDVNSPAGGGGAGAAIKSFNIKTSGEDKISVIVGAGGDATVNGATTSFGTYAIVEGGKAGSNGLSSAPGPGGLGGISIVTTPAISQTQKDRWMGKSGLSGFGIGGGTGGSSFFGLGACGGMSNGIFADCTETNENGLTAPNFDLSKVKYGGAGGGGGGVNGSVLGTGGKGGDGYIIVEWE